MQLVVGGLEAAQQFVERFQNLARQLRRYDVLVFAAWLPDRILFKAVNSMSGQAFHEFEFRGEVPPGGNPPFNLWLLGGQEPQSGRDVHVVLDAFSFQKI